MQFLPPLDDARPAGQSFLRRNPHMAGWSATESEAGITLKYDGVRFPDADLRQVVPKGLLGSGARVSRRRATGLTESQALVLIGLLIEMPENWTGADAVLLASAPAPEPAPAE